jgi:hypothetical protein
MEHPPWWTRTKRKHSLISTNGPSARKSCVDFDQGQGEILAYMDTGLSTSLEHLKDLIVPIRSRYDIVIGSRYQKALMWNGLFRAQLYSEMYNRTIRVFWDQESWIINAA